MNKDIYILVGPAAHGKSTYANKIINKHLEAYLDPMFTKLPGGYGYINADLIREKLYGDASIQGDSNEVWGKVYNAYSGFLNNPKVDLIIVDNTSLTWRLRKRYYNIAEKICDSYTLYTTFFLPNLKRALEWNKKRDRHVPEDVIARHCETFQGPTEYEKESCIIEYIK